MKKRKLLTPKVLTRLEALTNLGVPLAKAMGDLPISRPSAKKLLDIYMEQTARESLFPAWLDPNGPDVQEQPEDYNYIGFFPLGYWKCKNT